MAQFRTQGAGIGLAITEGIRKMKNFSDIVTAVTAIVSSLKDGDRIAVILRHGSRMEHKDLPNDTICDESWEQIRELGAAIRQAGIKLAKIIMTPRGRGVMAACALGEGNAVGDEAVAPFTTSPSLDDVSNDVAGGGPEILRKLKPIAKERGITGEQTLLLSGDPEIAAYAWRRAMQYADAIKTNSLADNIVKAFVSHGGVLDIAIAMLRAPKATQLAELPQPDQWLEMGQAAIVVFGKDGELVKVVYL